MSRIEAARATLGLTALPFVARATIAALREHPALNAWLDGEQYTRHQAVNLGIAVSLGEDGLIVPVVHEAHELSVEGPRRADQGPGATGPLPRARRPTRSVAARSRSPTPASTARSWPLRSSISRRSQSSTSRP